MSWLEKMGLRKQPAPEERALYEFPHVVKIPLAEALTTVQSNVDAEKRIRNPFEIPIDKKTITLDDLKKWGSALPIECEGAHDGDGTLVLMTGGRRDTGTDWPDALVQPPPEGWRNRKLREEIGHVNKANKARAERQTRVRQPYIMHNHPFPIEEPEILVPSFGDLMASPFVKSDVDIIVTRGHVIFYKRIETEFGNMFYTIYKQAEGENDVREFLERSGVLQAVIPFTNSEKMTHVLDFMRGDSDWAETEKQIGKTYDYGSPRAKGKMV